MVRFVAGRYLAVPVGEDNPEEGNPVVGEGSSLEREEDSLEGDNPEVGSPVEGEGSNPEEDIPEIEGDILEEGIPEGEDSSPEEDIPVEEGTEAVAVVVAAAVWERIRSPRPRP